MSSIILSKPHNSWTQLKSNNFDGPRNFIDSIVYSPDASFGLSISFINTYFNCRLIEMATGELMQYKFQREYYPEDKVRFVYLFFNMVRIKDHSQDSLRVSLQTTIQSVRNQYQRSQCCYMIYHIFIHNGRVLTDDDTALSLNIKDNDTIHVYTRDDAINVKVSLQSDIPNGMTFSLKYPDSFADIMKEYADRIGIDFNSVRFMYGEKRIKSGSNPLQLGIPPNAVIEVFKEYETITLEFVDGDNRDKTHQTQVNCGDSFIKILEDSVPFGMDPFSIELIQCGRGGITDEQTPKEREMDNNERIMVFKTLVINIKFIGPDDSSKEVVYIINDETDLELAKKSYAAFIKEDVKNLLFIFDGQSNTNYEFLQEYYVSEKCDTIVVEREQHPEKYIKLKIADQDSNEAHFRVLKTASLGKMKKAYADHLGISVSSLRFLFDGVRFNDEDTPNSIEMEEDDIIEVYKEQFA